jgi:hypothetical protein
MDKIQTIMHVVVFHVVVVAYVVPLISCLHQTQLAQRKIAAGIDNVIIPIVQQVHK